MLLYLIATVIAAATYYYIQCITFWRRQGVPQGSIKYTIVELINFFLQKKPLAESIQLNYNMFPESRYTGVYSFGAPILMIRDPDLLKDITVKNFDHFPDHTNIISEVAEPLWAKNLFALKGQRWRDMRPILSPSFTSSKMRSMFVLISECAQNFSHYYLKKDEQIIEVELKDSFTRFTNDVIATAAFGIKTDSLENKENQFYVMGKALTSFATGFFNAFKLVLLILFPKVFEIFQIGIFKKEVTTFFIDLIDSTVKTRKEKKIVRPDMIHLLMEAQKGLESKEVQVEDNSFAAQTEADLGKAVQQKDLSNLDIAAQALIFFFAGFETVSALMCFMAYELAINPDIQQKLREEIEETLENCNGELTYEALLKMKYLDMVVSESLRKWPSAIVADRECTKTYTIEPKLTGEKPVVIKKKMAIWLPIYGIHRDPNIYPEPEKFNPERFNDDNKANINPYTYLPFGLGPRNCIGSRFALLEVKTVFFYLLQNFALVPTQKSQIPLKLSAINFSLSTEGGFWFGLEKLKQ
ncbi:unnamed protein product [Psylliodes chrysocephalus]|uniref:Cytochrome P450 n=1 Tax=Psylliodes chrysocephalus TaxID=3402493 RepID=A0A9P0CIS1_9CUCU|nr:unnamed protein product [Psylliodes chrysocephala]